MSNLVLWAVVAFCVGVSVLFEYKNKKSWNSFFTRLAIILGVPGLWLLLFNLFPVPVGVISLFLGAMTYNRIVSTWLFKKLDPAMKEDDESAS